jgi:hypothetical protein
MKSFKDYIKEDAPAMSIGGGMQTLPSAQGDPIAGYDKMLGVGKMTRRKPPSTFGGKAVFKVNSDSFHKATHGKKKFKHYKSYVSGELGEEIRQYALENPNDPIILEDEKTGAMVYLKHGKNK